MKRVLVQWIGLSDLRAMAATLPPTKRKQIMERIGGSPSREGDLGPTKTFLTNQKFDEVRLFSNYESSWNKWFEKWLKTPVTIIPVDLENPTDYAAITEICDGELSKLKKRKNWEGSELCLHLSPGTPAMSAVWLLLGKTRYPATFYETSRDGKSSIPNIPFDLIDVIPEILRKPDAHLQHLAAESPSEIEGFEDLAGDSQAIRDAAGRAKRAALRIVSVLLLGESGTGKEMFAQAIYKASPRRKKPFLAINCAALSKSLLESELFGHIKGAFTGADRTRAGAFEQVNGGTLFLDEIGECDLETQAKLLRVLQPISGESSSVRVIRRLGDEKDKKVDVRIIAATNKDLHQAIKQGKFREDLYYRLASITVTLPPLRDRKSDISKIAERLLGQINHQFKTEEPDYEYKSLSPSAITFVKKHSWPGNVRQLNNVLVQAAVLTDGKKIGRRELAASLGEMPDSGTEMTSMMNRPLGDGFDLDEYLNTIHRGYLQRAMEESGGVKTKAAQLLGLKNYQTLDARLKRL